MESAYLIELKYRLRTLGDFFEYVIYRYEEDRERFALSVLFFYKRCIYADECFLVYITPLCLLMIPLAREDGEGAIDRLEQYYLHKLVREGEL